MSIVAGSDVVASDFDFLFCTPLPCFSKSAPNSNWKFCDGAAISRTTYATAFAKLVPNLGTFTVTIASPAVFTLNSHGLEVGDPVYLTTTGALPTGLSANTIYYVISAGLTSNAFELSATRGGAAINTSGSQSGTHTLRYCPCGLGDGSTTFNLPDTRTVIPVGYKSGDADHGYLGQTGGAKTHTLTTAEIPAHAHAIDSAMKTIGPGTSSGGSGASNDRDPDITTTGTDGGSGGAHNNLQPYITTKYIIRVL